MTQNTDGFLDYADHSASGVAITITEYNGVSVVDSRLIAERLGIKHKTFLETLLKHRIKLEQRFGVVAFETDKPLQASQGGRPEKYALLTEPQATTLMTFSRNTDQVVECKLALVEAFEKTKKVLKTVISSQTSAPMPAPQSSLDVLAQSLQALTQVAQSMAEVEHRQREQEIVLIQLVANKKQAEEELAALPLSETPAAEISVRSRINMIVRNYVQRTNADYLTIWGNLYKQLYYRYSIDVKARCSKSGRKPLDQIEADGKLEELYAIASEVLV